MNSTTTQSKQETWAEELMSSYASVADLEAAGFLSPDEAAAAREMGDLYRVRVPRSYAALIDKSDAACPIRLQAIPSPLEKDPVLPEWARGLSLEIFGRETPWDDDAIGDLAKQAAPRITHRYGSRAIMHVSSLCALYCRFCFRKTHLNDSERKLYEGSLDPAIAYLAARPEIREVILTGGDPLSLTDVALERLLSRLRAIEHVKSIRIHSRMSVTLPSRMTDGLFALLREFNANLVSHFNHPRELTPFARERVTAAVRSGVKMYNQSVLLRGVNDDVNTLATLFQELYELGATPFYLHHADWTPDTFKFRVSIEAGRRLVRDLAGRVSGPALPHYVLDLPGGDGKVQLLDAERAKLTRSFTKDSLSAAIYEIDSPQTRAGSTYVRYLDLTRI